MSVRLPELSSVRLRETPDELVVEVEVPSRVDLRRVSARCVDGRIEIRLPRVAPGDMRVEGFNPDASGV